MKLFSLSKIVSFFIFLVAITYADAQQRTCASHEHMQTLLQDEDFAREYEERMQAFEEYNTQNQVRSACPDPILIPIAVHYQNLNMNTADQQCLIDLAIEQINILNEDYSGTNADISTWQGVQPTYFPGINNGEGCVEFRLAIANHPTNSGLQNGEYAITFNQSSGDNAPGWNNYINIFVRDAGGGILGYSPLGGQGNTDGVVITPTAFSRGSGCAGAGGGSVIPQAPYNLGRTLTHELGHFLNLRHVWGNNGGCNDDDLVNDTPVSNAPNYGCTQNGFQSCQSNDLHMNYMDYSNDACMYMFTEGQITRMENYINNNLQNVVNNSDVFDFTPTAPVASYEASDVDGCAPFVATFADNSTNAPTSWSWSFPGGQPASSTSEIPPSVTYENPGTYNITLVVTNAEGTNTYESSVTVAECTDVNCLQIDNMNGGFATLIEAVDSNGDPQGGYVGGHNNFNDLAKAEFFDNYGTSTTINNVAFDFGLANGSGDMEFVIWRDNNGAPGTVIASQMVPVSTIANNVELGTMTYVDFGGSNTITGDFFVGFKLNTSSTVAINSNSDGDTNPTTAYEQWEDGTWYPFNDYTNSGTTWELDISLAIYPTVCNGQDTKVEDLLGITGANAYPNPVSNTFNLELSSDRAKDLNVDIYNALGQKVMELGTLSVMGDVNESYDVSTLAPGTYFARITDESNASFTMKFLKM